MVLTLKKGGEFIPKFNGNDTLSEGQVVIHWEHLTYAEFVGATDMESGRPDSALITKTMVKKVDGLSVADGKKKRAVEDGAGLFAEELPYDLMNEIMAFCMTNFSPELDPTA